MMTERTGRYRLTRTRRSRLRPATCSDAGLVAPDKPRSAYFARKFFPHLGEHHGSALVEELMRIAQQPNVKSCGGEE